MNLNGIPAYALRSYLLLLSKVRHLDHPDLTQILLREKAKWKIMGAELLTQDVLEMLGQFSVKAIWRRITLAEQLYPIPSCPEEEKLPYDDGKEVTQEKG